MSIFQALRKLWPYLRPYKSKLVIIVVLGIVISAGMGILPKLAQLLLEDVLEKKNAEYAAWLPFTFPILYLVIGSARYFHFFYVKYVGELMIASLRRSLLNKCTRLNLTFHNSFESGSGGLMSRVFNDTTLLMEGLFYMGDIVREPLVAVAVLTSMLYINWKLTLISLIFAPLLITIIRAISKSLRKYGRRNREAMDELTSTMKESLDGVRIIQSFNLEDEMQNRFGRNLDRYLGTRRSIISREEAVSPLNEFMGSLLVMGLTLFVISEVFSGRSSAGEFTAFLVAAGLLQMPIKKLQDAFVRMQQTVVVVERLFGLLDNSSQVPQVDNPVPFPDNWKTIHFRNVSFAYGSELVLRNVNLTIQRGEVIALVGESGSGKSTIVNLLSRFFDPSTGEITIDNIPIRNFDLKELREKIALVTQDVFLFRDSIARNIQAGAFQKPVAGVEAAARSANAHGFITNTPQAYESQVGERGNFLSGGEKQRLSIARAIFKDAPILILDEATSALDSVSELEVQKGLNELMQGRTVFVIAHRLSTVYSADRILVLKKGEVIEQGTHEELLNRVGEYHNFFQLQRG